MKQQQREDENKVAIPQDEESVPNIYSTNVISGQEEQSRYFLNKSCLGVVPESQNVGPGKEIFGGEAWPSQLQKLLQFEVDNVSKQPKIFTLLLHLLSFMRGTVV